MAQIGHCDPSSAPKVSLGWTHITMLFDLVLGFSQEALGLIRPHFGPKGPILVSPISVYLVFVGMSKSYAWRELHTAAVLHMLGGQTQLIIQSHYPHWIYCAFPQ